MFIIIDRGALIKPWIFTEIKEQRFGNYASTSHVWIANSKIRIIYSIRHWDISSNERFEILRKFANNGLEHWGSDSMVILNSILVV